MKLTVNGEPLEIEKPINVKELLVVAKAEQPEYVTVELNGEFVDHSGFESTLVKDGDTVDVDAASGTRRTRWFDVQIRVSDKFRLEMHVGGGAR